MSHTYLSAPRVAEACRRGIDAKQAAVKEAFEGMEKASKEWLSLSIAFEDASADLRKLLNLAKLAGDGKVAVDETIAGQLINYWE